MNTHASYLAKVSLWKTHPTFLYTLPKKLFPLLFLVVLFSYADYNILTISNPSFTEKILGSRQLWTASHIPAFCDRLANFFNIPSHSFIRPCFLIFFNMVKRTCWQTQIYLASLYQKKCKSQKHINLNVSSVMNVSAVYVT